MNRYKKISLLTFAVMIIALSMFLIINSFSAEEQDIASPSLTTENYTVFITEADNITYIRYAAGEYTSSSDIKNAPDCVTLDSSAIKESTVNGILSCEMPDGGTYSFWIKNTDGTQHIFSTVSVTNMTPEVTTDGVTVTVSNFYGATDLFIAKGSWSTYKEIKDNGYIVSVKNKLIGTKSYSYTLSEEGKYTALLRYADKIWYEHFTIECEHPSFSENGLQLTVGNLEGVKCIRTAYGEYSSISAIKKADTHRAFTAKAVIKGKDEYTIQYRTNGTVTVAVQYENGYNEFFNYNVMKKTPTVTQNDNTLTFGDLEDLKVLRYAKGEYTSSVEIKFAEGSKYLKANSVTDGYITLTLDPGTYSFCVQYNDESYNYYIVTIGSTGVFTKNNTFTNVEGEVVTSLPYWLYTPANAVENMPLIVVLHSAHVKAKSDVDWETNLDSMMTTQYNDLPKLIYNGEFGEIPAYIVMPQTDGSSRGWAKRGAEIVELIDYCERTFKTDSNKISIMGYSLGGTGAFELATAYPDIFDRVLSVAGGLDGVTNNTRPYIPGVGRLALSDSYYPDLRIATDSGYAKEMMKYQYAETGSSSLAATDNERAQAADFEKERISSVSQILRDAGISVWAIVGSLDAEVAPSVSDSLCTAIGDTAKCDTMEGYSHSKTPTVCIDKKDEILDFLLNY